MNTDYTKWIDALKNFESKREKDLKEIRALKAEILQAKNQLTEQLEKGQFYRDEERIIISAPEIIIGNLSKDGTLNTTQPSKVIIRSNNISLEGVGDSDGTIIGTITQKASKINNIGIDPGIDGLEEAVRDTSEFSVQACSIAMLSEDTTDVFIDQPIAGNGTITLSADNKINMEAAKPGQGKANDIKIKSSHKENEEKSLKENYETKKIQMEATAEYLKKLLDYDKDVKKTPEDLRTNLLELETLQVELENTVRTLSKELSECGFILGKWAEASRQKKGLDAKEKDIETKAKKYKDDGNGTSINMLAESTNIRSMDADSNIIKNNGAGLHIVGKNIDINTLAEGSVIDQSQVSIHTQSIDLSTENPKEEGENMSYSAEGNIHILSKNIVMESVDYEMKKGEDRAEKALTKDGNIKMRAESMEFSSYDTEGKASGKFSINSKDITLKAMDVDKEKLTDKEMAKDSTLKLMSDKIYAGNPEEKALTQQIQMSADKIGIFAKTTAEMQQNEAKATLQLDSGNIALSGEKATLYGETTLHGKTTFKSETIQGKATVDNIEIKTSFKSPNTSEGIGVPGSPSTEKLSTKLKEEKEINKKEE